MAPTQNVRWTGYVAKERGKETMRKILSANLSERDHFGDFGLGWRIIQKAIIFNRVPNYVLL